MSIQLTSTTDSTETVAAVMAPTPAEPAKDETKSATATEVTEETTTEDSETSDEKVETESEDADGDDETEGKEEPQAEDKSARKPKGFKKRIDKLTKRLSDKEREADYWRTEALKAKPKEEPAKIAKEEPTGKPKSDEFETHDEYVEALADWKVEQKLKARDAKDKETQVKTEYQSRVELHQKRVEEFSSKHDDFQDLMEEVDDIPMSIAVQEGILRSENGPALMYELAKNRETYERICRLPAIEAAIELGKFEARFIKTEEKSEPKEIKQTKAPPPIKPVGSKSAGAVAKSIYDADLSQQEFERLRKEQLAKRA